MLISDSSMVVSVVMRVVDLRLDAADDDEDEPIPPDFDIDCV